MLLRYSQVFFFATVTGPGLFAQEVLPAENIEFGPSSLTTISRQECTNQGGVVLPYDIFQPDTACDSSTDGNAIAVVVPQDGEPMSTEPEICCGADAGLGTDPNDSEPIALPSSNGSYLGTQITSQECTEQGGEVVSDIGTGAVFEPGYFCKTTGQPPIALVAASFEGAVCCGPPLATDPELPIFNTPDEQVTRQKCADQGGEIVGDIGNGAIFKADYVCDSNGEPPIARVVPQAGEPIAIEGEVCCGPPATDPELPIFNAPDEQVTRQECTDQGGEIVGDIGNGAIFKADYVCDSNGEPPIARVVLQAGEPIAIEGEVCCGPTNQPERPQMSRTECTEAGGEITYDIGDGSIHRPNYICASSGEPPIATVIPGPNEPISREGEVCCRTNAAGSSGGDEIAREEISRDECADQGGEVVGDIGDGAIHKADYVCDSNGQPPIATVIPSDGEAVAIEGEVCCGNALDSVIVQSQGLSTGGKAGIGVGVVLGGVALLLGGILLVSKGVTRETSTGKESASTGTDDIIEADVPKEIAASGDSSV